MAEVRNQLYKKDTTKLIEMAIAADLPSNKQIWYSCAEPYTIKIWQKSGINSIKKTQLN
ncbi:hypothetical protein EHE19_012700 [Ruminiclostridium herbifermentans]|uniref:Uncharacterized protein n=1 Tax=Ruminiclostridium herbifermentans TaxID=2488810 RepID=A0A7H1VK52_9FIRM|nr:hypothetical protein EHE19_012700 [Ruminiclostridium herbifermentans]